MSKIENNTERGLWLTAGIVLSGVVMGFAPTGGYGLNQANAEQADVEVVRTAFQERFIETTPDEIDCDGFGPLCQVIAGTTVLYVDPKADHAFIGRLYDLENKKDLTEEALSRVRPATPDTPEPQQAAIKTSGWAAWDNLPFETAIQRNLDAPLKVAIFSDLNCGYCKQLGLSLAKVDDIEINEFLIGRMNSTAQSQAIGCAESPNRALAAYWKKGAMPQAKCDRDIVTPAQIAFGQIGARGTPTFVRSDGAITSGFMGLDELRNWLEAADSKLATEEN